MRGIMFKAGDVEMWVRRIIAIGVSGEEYQVRSPRLGLTGLWHRDYANAVREFQEQVALAQPNAEDRIPGRGVAAPVFASGPES